MGDVVHQLATPSTRELILARAEAWYQRQIKTLEMSLGAQWQTHRHWVEAYLREEIRQRLIARGWRPKA